ncbi:MAG TPA: tetratricopeptide repeat protein [Longimicrobium sp.]|nr:tetratricopeptide repeat protein [Longimicrobium sp.]
MATNTAKLRERARAHELKDQWREAIGVYRELLDEAEGGAEVDIALYNRIGDLHLRLNETELAIQAYESAVNAYVDVGLYNNAIALCRKILRLVPGRAATYLRLGQISAAKGFFADARQNFLEYAERMRKAGKLDASFDALKEFADLSPDPADVRRLLAEQFLGHGRKDEAVEQLRILLSLLEEGGDAAGAEAVRRQIVTVDPTAATTGLARQARGPAAADDFRSAFDTGLLPPSAPAPAPGAPPRDAGEDVQVGAALDQDYGNVDLDVAPLEGLESTMLDAPPAAPPARGAPPAAGADEDDDAEGMADLPLLDMDAPAAPAERGPDPARFGEVSLDEQPMDFAAGYDYDDDEDDGGADPLPLLDVDAPPAPPARDRLETLRERVAAAPEDHAARDELVPLLHDRGLGHEVPGLLEEAHRALAARGLFRDAIEPISALIRLRGDDPLLLQKRVEYAFRSGDREAQVAAYLALGRHLAATGERAKGEAVFRRVLELDPANDEARSAIAMITPAAPAPAAPEAPAQPAAPAADYIDLGELILGVDDGREPTTRFVVEEREPTGDEDKDFADMLAHFRQKVAENIEVEDSTSHYDLGLAFKEMGLLDEAIAEFQVALRGGANPLATLELLGQCFVEKGQYAVAVRVLDRALKLPGSADGELVGVLYNLGRAEEALGRTPHAIELYERVLSFDIRFRDTQARIEALRAASGAAPL